MPSPSMIAQFEEEQEHLAKGGGADLDKPFHYLAGPMTGYPRLNIPAFMEAASRLRGKGYNLVNPPELDHELQRVKNWLSKDGEHEPAFYRECLRRDLDIVLHPNCVGVILIDGWEKSGGARIETYNAAALGIPIYEYFSDDDLDEHALILIDRKQALREAGIDE